MMQKAKWLRLFFRENFGMIGANRRKRGRDFIGIRTEFGAFGAPDPPEHRQYRPDLRRHRGKAASYQALGLCTGRQALKTGGAGLLGCFGRDHLRKFRGVLFQKPRPLFLFHHQGTALLRPPGISQTGLPGVRPGGRRAAGRAAGGPSGGSGAGAHAPRLSQPEPVQHRGFGGL